VRVKQRNRWHQVAKQTTYFVHFLPISTIINAPTTDWGTHPIQINHRVNSWVQPKESTWHCSGYPNQKLIPTLNFPLLRLPKSKTDSNAWFFSYTIHLWSSWCKLLSIGHLVAKFLTHCPHHQAYRIFMASHAATSQWPNYYNLYTSEKSSQLPRGSRVHVKQLNRWHQAAKKTTYLVHFLPISRS